MATFREVLVKIFCAKRYATREEEKRARLEARTRWRRRTQYGTTASPLGMCNGTSGFDRSKPVGTGYFSHSSRPSHSGALFGTGTGIGGSGFDKWSPGPCNDFGKRPGPGW
jgi:hypothetical protein